MSNYPLHSARPTRPARPSLRSRLYVPGTKVSWIEKGVASGADAIILDLDDAVPAGEKESARADVAGALDRGADVPLFVRINDLSTPWVLDDIEAIVRPGLFGIVVPRLTSLAQVTALDVLLSWLEVRADLPEGTVVLSPIYETAITMHFAFDFAAASSRVEYVGGIATDGGDVERELGYRWSSNAWESSAMRATCLLAVRAAGVAHPMTGIWTSLEDLGGLRAFATQGRNLGYVGIDVIHPAHVATANEVFGYDEATILQAQRILELASEVDDSPGSPSDERTIGAFRFEGRMIDAAMVRTATDLLRRAGRLN